MIINDNIIKYIQNKQKMNDKSFESYYSSKKDHLIFNSNKKRDIENAINDQVSSLTFIK